MTIAVIGTGNMGRGLARVFSGAGHQIFLGSRDPERARAIAAELGGSVIGAGNLEAAHNGAIVFLAYHSNALLLDELASVLEGKTVVDISTYLDEPAREWNPVSGEEPASAQELTQRRLPKSRVFAAFQNTYAQLFDEPLIDGQKTPVFVVGEDPRAKAELLQLIAGLPFEPIDGGPLERARRIAAMYFVISDVGARYRTSAQHDWRCTVRALNALLRLALT